MKGTNLRVEGLITGRRRDGKNFYDEVARRRLIALCQEGAASVATIAVANGINPNVLHRWLALEETRGKSGTQNVPQLLPVLITDHASDADIERAVKGSDVGDETNDHLEIVFCRGTLRLRRPLDEALLRMIADALACRC